MAPALVVTTPDAPRGRGRKIYPAELRLAAEELGLPCEQPEDPRAPEFLDVLRGHKLDLGVVVSYGVILNRELLEPSQPELAVELQAGESGGGVSERNGDTDDRG